jgi:hypothetical protein
MTSGITLRKSPLGIAKECAGGDEVMLAILPIVHSFIFLEDFTKPDEI